MEYSLQVLERNLSKTSEACKELEEKLVNFCKNERGFRTIKREADRIFPQVESLLQQSQLLDNRISQAEHQVEEIKSRLDKSKVHKEDLLQLRSILENLNIVSQGVNVAEELRSGQRVPESMDLETLSSYERQIQQGIRCLYFIHSFGISNSCLANSQSLMEKEHVRLRSEMVARLISCFHWYDWGLSIDEEAIWISSIVAQGKYMELAIQEIVSLLNHLGIAAHLQRASKVEIRANKFLIDMQVKKEDALQPILEWEDCPVQELDVLESCLDMANGCKRALVFFDFILNQTFGTDYHREVAVGFYEWFRYEVCSCKCILGHFRYLADLDAYSDPTQFPLRLRALTICAEKLRMALQARGMDISLAESLVPDFYRAEEDLASFCRRHVLVYARNILKSVSFNQDDFVNVSSFLASSEYLYLTGKLVDAGELCPFSFPVCKVTRQSIELIQSAERIFQDANICLQSNLSLLGSTLMESISEMFLLYYRIVSANCHNLLKSQLLAQAVYHNDCFLLAHICCILEMRKSLLSSHMNEESTRHLKKLDFMTACFRLRYEGSSFLSKSISATKDAIYACVTKATEGGSMEVCYQTSIFNRIQRSLDAASLSFESLLISWKDYLPKSVLRSIGFGLLENYCQWLIQAVFALDEIPQKTCSYLASLLQEEIDKKTNLVAQIVNWEQSILSDKCNGISSLWWISKILNSNLEEIVKMVQQGPLRRRIEKDHLVKLVTALFEKTNYRKNCLQQIAIAYSTQRSHTK